MNKNDKPIPVRLSSEAYDMLVEMAEAEQRPYTWELERIIRQAYKAGKWKPKPGPIM